MNENRPSRLRKGDLLPEDLINKADCPAEGPRLTFQAPCALDKGHAGPHVAIGSNGSIVEVWD